MWWCNGPGGPRARRWRRVAAAACLAAALNGCGFHLRGSDQRIALKGVYVEGNASNELLRQLSRFLQLSGASLAKERKDANYIMNLTGEQAGKSVLTVSQTGQVLEYELHYAVTFETMDRTGRRLVGPQRVSVVRDVTYNPSTALGKANEEQRLYGHLHTEVIQQIIYRLQTKLGK